MHHRLPRLLVVVVALAACSSEKPSTATKKLHGIPTLTGATRPPGAELGNGFTVAAGAALMADVFPLGADEALANLPFRDGGWRALLLVTGDPREVVRHYLRQAERHGLTLRSGDRWSGPSIPEVPRPDVYCGTDAAEGYLCAAAGARTTGSRTRSFQLLLRRQSESRGVPLSSSRSPTARALRRYHRHPARLQRRSSGPRRRPLRPAGRRCLVRASYSRWPSPMRRGYESESKATADQLHTR